MATWLGIKRPTPTCSRKLANCGLAAGGTTTGELVDFLADKLVAQHLLAADVKFFPLFSDESLQPIQRDRSE
jgi:hypothetical protein